MARQVNGASHLSLVFFLFFLPLASLPLLFVKLSIGRAVGGMAASFIINVHLIECAALLLVVYSLDMDLGLLLDIEIVLPLLVLWSS